MSFHRWNTKNECLDWFLFHQFVKDLHGLNGFTTRFHLHLHAFIIYMLSIEVPTTRLMDVMLFICVFGNHWFHGNTLSACLVLQWVCHNHGELPWFCKITSYRFCKITMKHHDSNKSIVVPIMLVELETTIF